MTSRKRTRFCCTDCGQVAAVWNGRCTGCGGWNTLTEERVGAGVDDGEARRGGTAPTPLAELSAIGAGPVSVGVAEVDRVLAGGLVPGSVTLLSGPPGIGKSTLALQMAAGVAHITGTAPVLYVAAEETVAQIRLRADRIGAALPPSLLVTDVSSLDVIAEAMDSWAPATVIVDSIQAVADPSVDAAPGSVIQVRTCAQRLADRARVAGTSLVLIGHVTKDGAIAGPRLLEHLVDTVATFDADADHHLRLLRAVKHRFGPVGELGVFTMESDGLAGVPDVGGLFLRGRRRGAAGSVAAPVLEGRRTLVVEVQALVEPGGPGAVRVCQGLNRGRVELVRAVLERCAGVTGDLSCSVAGGFGVSEPAVDLALAVAVVSAVLGVPVDDSTVICGELGLVGEVRDVGSLNERLSEAARLGFTGAVVPQTAVPDIAVDGLQICGVADVAEAINAAIPHALRAATAPHAHDASGARSASRPRGDPPMSVVG